MLTQQSDHDRVELQRAHQAAVADRHIDDMHQERIAGLRAA